MRVLIEMPVKIRRKIRCRIGAEKDDFSVSSSYVLDRKILIEYYMLKNYFDIIKKYVYNIKIDSK